MGMIITQKLSHPLPPRPSCHSTVSHTGNPDGHHTHTHTLRRVRVQKTVFTHIHSFSHSHTHIHTGCEKVMRLQGHSLVLLGQP